VRSALEQMPDLSEAHALLADHYREQVAQAEALHDRAGAAEAMALLRSHDDGRHADWIAGRGRLYLTTDVPGARFSIARYTTVDRRLQLGPFRDLGGAPVETVLDRGSYMVHIEAPGHARVKLPVLIERETGWVQTEPVLMPTEDELGPDDVYVPAGWFIFGGDPAAIDALPRRRIWLDGFIIRRHPVTVAEYGAFLSALRTDGLAIHTHLPQNGTDGTGRETIWDLDGNPPPSEPRDWPVIGVTWYSAAAYAKWSQNHGQPWRLAHELEWEKAARGADGRIYPWGNFSDPAWACMFDSRKGTARRAGVGEFPTDESPYGVRGMGGNTRDWCSNLYLRAGPDSVDESTGQAALLDDTYRIAKGGAWSAVRSQSRAGGRFGSRPHDTFSSLGFRLARTWPAQSSAS
jgi:serine/threonine-protein kinase